MEELWSWWEVPSIAHFCSLFRAAFGLPDFDIEDFEVGLMSSGSEFGSVLINNIITSLLKGIFYRRHFKPDRVEAYLSEALENRYETELQKPYPLKDTTFNQLSLRVKVEVLYQLCDCRLEVDTVQDVLKGLEADSLRVEPMGTDNSGALYWYFYGTRLYKEDSDIIPKQENHGNGKKKSKDKKKKIKDKRKRKKEKDKIKTKKKKDKNDKDKKSKTKKNLKNNQHKKDNSGISQGKVQNSKSHKKKHSSKQDRGRSAAVAGEDEEVRDDESDEDAVKAAGEEEEEGWEDEKPSRWHMVCTNEQDWKDLASKFEKSKYKCERELYKTLVEDFLPEIPKMIEAKERERKKELLAFLPRRSSGRLQEKQQLKREQEPSSDEDGGRMELSDDEEEEKEQLRKTVAAREARERRALKREGRLPEESEGKDVTINGHSGTRPGHTKRKGPLDNEVISAMSKVLNVVKCHEDAWPFSEPVQESYAPNYFAIIKNPMDLSTMERHLKAGHYQSREQFREHFTLIMHNCRLYNGPESEYTEMSQVVEKCFNRAYKKCMPAEESDSEEEYVVRASSSSRRGANSEPEAHHHRPQRMASSRAIAAIHWNNEELQDSSSSEEEFSSSQESGEEKYESPSVIKSEKSQDSTSPKPFRLVAPTSRTSDTEQATVKQEQLSYSVPGQMDLSQPLGGSSVVQSAHYFSPGGRVDSQKQDHMTMHPKTGLRQLANRDGTQGQRQGEPPVTGSPKQPMTVQGKTSNPPILSSRHAFPNLMRAAAAAASVTNTAAATAASNLLAQGFNRHRNGTHTPPATPPKPALYRGLASRTGHVARSDSPSCLNSQQKVSDVDGVKDSPQLQGQSSPTSNDLNKENESKYAFVQEHTLIKPPADVTAVVKSQSLTEASSKLNDLSESVVSSASSEHVSVVTPRDSTSQNEHSLAAHRDSQPSLTKPAMQSVSAASSPRMMGMHHNLPRVITGSPYRAGHQRLARANSPSTNKFRNIIPKPTPTTVATSLNNACTNVVSQPTDGSTDRVSSDSVTVSSTICVKPSSNVSDSSSSLPVSRQADIPNATTKHATETGYLPQTYTDKPQSEIQTSSTGGMSHLSQLENMISRSNSNSPYPSPYQSHNPETGNSTSASDSRDSHHSFSADNVTSQSSLSAHGNSNSMNPVSSASHNLTSVPDSHDAAAMLLSFSRGFDQRSNQGQSVTQAMTQQANSQNEVNSAASSVPISDKISCSLSSSAGPMTTSQVVHESNKTQRDGTSHIDHVNRSSHDQVNDLSHETVSKLSHDPINKSSHDPHFRNVSHNINAAAEPSNYSVGNQYQSQTEKVERKQKSKKRKAESEPDACVEPKLSKTMRLDNDTNNTQNANSSTCHSARFSSAENDRNAGNCKTSLREVQHGIVTSKYDSMYQQQQVYSDMKHLQNTPYQHQTSHSHLHQNSNNPVYSSGTRPSNMVNDLQNQGYPNLGHHHGNNSVHQSAFQQNLQRSEMKSQAAHHVHASRSHLDQTSNTRRSNSPHVSSSVDSMMHATYSQPSLGRTKHQYHDQALQQMSSMPRTSSPHQMGMMRPSAAQSEQQVPNSQQSQAFDAYSKQRQMTNANSDKSGDVRDKPDKQSHKERQHNDNKDPGINIPHHQRKPAVVNNAPKTDSQNKDKGQPRQATVSPQHNSLAYQNGGGLHSSSSPATSHAGLTNRHMMGIDAVQQYHHAASAAGMGMSRAGYSQHHPSSHPAHPLQSMYPMMAGQAGYLGVHHQAMAMHPSSAGYMMGLPPGAGMTPDHPLYQQYIQQMHLQQRMQEEHLLIQQHQMMSKGMQPHLMSSPFATGGALMQSSGFPPQQGNAPGNPYANPMQPPSFP